MIFFITSVGVASNPSVSSATPAFSTTKSNLPAFFTAFSKAAITCFSLLTS